MTTNHILALVILWVLLFRASDDFERWADKAPEGSWWRAFCHTVEVVTWFASSCLSIGLLSWAVQRLIGP